MRRRGLCAVVIGCVFAIWVSPGFADPDDEIEMDPDAGSGSGSAKKPADKPVDKPADKPAPPVEPKPADPNAPVEKDPKLAKKLVATAQQSVAKADALVRQKKAEEAKKEYETAVAAYTKAIELGDDPNVLFDLGLVEDKLGKTAQAATHWRTLIKTAGAKADVVKKAQAKFDDATTKIGQLTLTTKPEGATITVDGAELGKTPLAAPLLLMPGTYNLQLAADGFQLKSVEVNVEAGSESERGIDLEPIKVVIENKPVVVEDKPEQPVTKPNKLPIYVGGGAAVGLFAIGTVTGLLAVGQHGTYTAKDSSAQEREDARVSGKNLAHFTDAMLVGTVVAGGFTAYWYFFKYKPQQKKFDAEGKPRSGGMVRRQAHDPAKAAVVPWVQPDAGGLTAVGRF